MANQSATDPTCSSASSSYRACVVVIATTRMPAARPACDARGGVLEDDAVRGARAQLGCAEQVALGIGLAARDALGRDEDRGDRQPRGAQPGGGERHYAGGDDRDGSVALEQLARPWKGDDVARVGGLDQVDGRDSSAASR